jgi:hypothetical protein
VYLSSLLEEQIDINQYLVVAKVKDRLGITKQEMQKFDMEGFKLIKLKYKVKKKYQVKISNGFAALKLIDDYVDSNRAWEIIRKNITVSAKEWLGIMNQSISHGLRKDV